MKQQLKFVAKMPLLFAVSFAISGCATETPPPGLLFCDVARPVFISREDIMTEETERQILVHNTVGERLCDWGRKNNVAKNGS